MSEPIGIEIDRGVCTGSGTCEALDPHVFQLDDDGLAYIVDGSAPSEEVQRRAVEMCPSGAIRFAAGGAAA